MKGVEYILSGTATDGSFKAYSEKKFKLTLNGLSLTSAQGAAINIQSGKRVFVEAVDGTVNTLTEKTKRPVFSVKDSCCSAVVEN